MKRNFIIRNVIIGIIIIAIIAVLSIYFIGKNAKKYEVEKVNSYNYFVLEKDNLLGVIDRNGNIVIEAKYDNVVIPNPEKNLYICYEGENTRVFNEKQEEILNNYQNIQPVRLQNITSDLMYEKSILTYEQDGKYGLINFEGKQITKPIYESIEGLPYKEGELLVKKDGKYGVINIKGNQLIDIIYDKISVDGYYTSENTYKYAGYIVSNTTNEGYRYGYINYDGKLLLEPEYNELSRVIGILDNENAYILCAKNGQYGIMKNDEELIPNNYQSIEYDESNKVFTTEKSKKYGITNLNGDVIIAPEYSQIDITGIYLYAKNDQGVTVYNTSGTQVNIDTNVAILNTSNEKYRIRIDNTDGTKYGVINENGEQVIDEKYNYIEYLFDDYFIVSNSESKLGVINDNDEIKIDINYDGLQKIDGTNVIQASITSENIVKLFSKDLREICSLENAKVENKGDYIKISNNTDTMYFDKDGKELKNTDVFSSNTLFANKENDKWGFVNKSGNIVVDAKYDKVTEFNEYGFAGVKLDGKWGVVNSKGEEILEPTYTLNEEQEPFFIGNYYRVRYGFGEYYYTDLNNEPATENTDVINETTDENITNTVVSE